MPKLDGTLLPQRIAARLADLKEGKKVAARDIKALLNETQIAEMEAAWAHQQNLRARKRARTKEEEKALGWKSKREIHIEAYEAALAAAENNELSALEEKAFKTEVRGGRIFLDAFFAARDNGINDASAMLRANNALTRAGLQRLDAAIVGAHGLTKRDRELRQMEEAILKRAESEMTPEEREQLELLREYEKALDANKKKSVG